MAVRRTFRLQRVWNSWHLLKGGMAVFDEDLREYFDVPAEVQDIWLCVHDSPGDSLWPSKVELEKKHGHPYPVLWIGSGRARFEAEQLDNRLRSLMKHATVHVGVEYY